MNKLILLSTLFVLSLYTNRATGQHATTVTQDTANGLRFFVDPRVKVLIAKHKDVKLGVIRSGKGYRVQIYSGTDRNKANQIKIDFMRRFPGTRSYLTYSSPQYRVKVGDYTDRADAQKMYNQLYRIFNPSMIVPDLVEINTLKDD